MNRSKPPLQFRDGNPTAAIQTKPKVLLLDLWKTLARASYPEPVLLLQELLGYKCESGKPKETDPAFLQACLTIGLDDPDEYIEEVARRFALTVPAEAREAFKQVIRKEQDGLSFYDDMETELAALREQGYALGLLSNVWTFPVRKIRKRVQPLFDHLILSCEVGYAKPSKEVFLHSANKFGVRPEECMMIGDNPELDIRGALAVGMSAVLIERYLVVKQPVLEVSVEVIVDAATGKRQTQTHNVPIIGNMKELYSAD